jgi:hypothetical protein
MILVKALELIVPDAPGHRWDVVDVGLRHHRCHGRIDIPGLKLVTAVRLPQCDEIQTSHIVLLVYLRLSLTHCKCASGFRTYDVEIASAV